MDVTACNDSSGAKAPAPVSKPSDGAGAQQAASPDDAKTLEESVISACPEPAATKKRSTDSATDNGSDAATLATKKQKLVRCGSSVADLLAKTQEVESLGKNAISDEQQRQTKDNRAADSVSVDPMRNIVDVEGYKTELYRIPHDTPGAHKQTVFYFMSSCSLLLFPLLTLYFNHGARSQRPARC